ncbi:protease SohB [Psychromonas sp. Urea-02u-13]|uniref:protease SohB n=1 Tax=Psychromonas sp. Urea-02u-13 TaxID=2058326 RepID=UPI000C31CE74|nr:protease SohB [Psychromonas sp. Urea-02u-13]PKG39604.1 protease SohB [Psychromonas sp. Urea-02u-13]
MEFLFEYGLFLAKAITFVVTVAALLIIVIALTSKQKTKKGEIELTDISEQLKETKKSIEEQLLSAPLLKARQKKDKKAEKEKVKLAKKLAKDGEEAASLAQLYVLDFKGSIDAKEVSSLREEITAILSVASDKDEVFVRLESGGGMVHGYGLAASQLQRLKDNNIPLTIAVDKVAASGGYMMTCIADKIISAPFAILGSIGVIAQIPNFHKVLKKHDIEFEQLTAGDYKRTLTMFGENDDKGRAKFKQELQETHDLFKTFVSDHRPSIDIEKVATGEHWYGLQAIKLNLVDKISTSDDYLLSQLDNRHIVQIKYTQRKKLADKFGQSASLAFENSLLKLMQLNVSRLFK